MAMNDTVAKSHGMTPYFAVFGRHPRSLASSAIPLPPEPAQESGAALADLQQHIADKIKAALEKAQD